MRLARVAFLSGLAAAALVFGSFSVWPVPDFVIEALGGATGVRREGGVRVRYQPAAGQEEAAARLAGSVLGGREGSLLLLEYPGLEVQDEPSLRAMLERGGLRVREVLESTSYAIALYERHSSEGQELGAVVGEVDMWIPDNGKRHVDYFLKAPTRSELERAVAAAAESGLPPPPGSEVAYERQQAQAPSEEQPQGTPAFWRSYVIRQQDALDGSMVEAAEVSHAPDTDRPQVLLTLTAAGRERFCEISSRALGHKLATLMGDEILSAPYINGPVCGGEIAVRLGGEDLGQQTQKARVLARLLPLPPLPRGGGVVSIEEVAAASQGLLLLAARALLGLAVGVLVGVLTLGLLRWAQPRWIPATPRWPGRFPWKRLGITLLAPLGLVAGAYIPLPGVNVDWLIAQINPGALRNLPPLHAASLGVTPVLNAFVLVEVIALAVPALRWRRHDPRGRRGLGRAVAAVTLALALAQGWFISKYLTLVFDAMGRDTGLVFQLGVTASLACGAMLLAVLAGVINEHGLGNGYGVLVTCGALLELTELTEAQRMILHVPHGMAIIGTIGITAVFLRWRVGGAADKDGDMRLRLPTSSLVPLLHAGGLLLLIGGLSMVGLFQPVMKDGLTRVQAVLASPWTWLAFVLGLVVLWSWLLARPSLLAAAAKSAGLAPPSMTTWARATGLSAAMSGSVALLYLAVPGTSELVSTSVAMFCTAAVMDVFVDARARRAQLVPVAVLHQVQRGDVVEHVLGSAAIPFHLRDAHLRTLLAFFGPYVPVTVLVPAEHGERALALLEALHAEPPSALFGSTAAPPRASDHLPVV